MSDKIDLKRIMQKQQETLVSTLGYSEIFDHPTAKGDVKEHDWCTFLTKFLPTRYQVSKAFVIDAEAGRSESLDVVIHDRHYCPLFFEHGGQKYIPAESVYAVFDVKPQLTRDDILYTAGKVASVRRLHRTSAVIVDRGQVYQPRDAFRIIGGILTTGSSWKPPLGDSLEAALQAADGESQLDIGCAITGGAFDVIYGPPLYVARSTADVSLMFFIIRLMKRLQALGTVTAIDLDAYSRWLQEERSSK